MQVEKESKQGLRESEREHRERVDGEERAGCFA